MPVTSFSPTKTGQVSDARVEAESLCRQIAARDLGETPLYIVPQSRLPMDLGGRSVCDGYTTASLDLYLREQIGVGWRGRGPCMVINDIALGKETDPRDFQHAFLAVSVHELAHILERPTLFYVREEVTATTLRSEAVRVATTVSSDPLPEDKPLPFTGHGARFILTALHLLHRADMAGTHIAAAPVCAGDNYCLSHAERYRHALGEDPQQFANLTFAEIHQIDPPAAFAALWEADVTSWFGDKPVGRTV